MPFLVEWAEEAKLELAVLHELASRGASLDFLDVVQAAMGRQHNYWLRGLPFRDLERTGHDIRMLNNGNISLVYELFEAQQRVRVLNILRNSRG